MPRKTDNLRPEAKPHPDGFREGVMNDSTGVEIGIASNIDQANFDQMKNPFKTYTEKDDSLKQSDKQTSDNKNDV